MLSLPQYSGNSHTLSLASHELSASVSTPDPTELSEAVKNERFSVTPALAFKKGFSTKLPQQWQFFHYNGFSGTLRLPRPFEQTRFHIISFLCPKLDPSIEPFYLSYQAAHLQTSHGPVSIALHLCLSFSLLWDGFGGVGDTKSSMILAPLVVALMSAWLLVFLRADHSEAGSLRSINMSQILVALSGLVYVLWHLLQVTVSLSQAYISLSRLLALFFFLGHVPSPLSLGFLLVLSQITPIAWMIVCNYFCPEIPDGFTILRHGFCMYCPLIFFFLAFRRHEMERRIAFANERFATHLLATAQGHIQNLSSHEHMQKLMHKKKSTLNTLRAKLEDPISKARIQRIHETLISRYVRLSQATPDTAGTTFAALSEGFGSLKVAAAQESNRLSIILKGLYENFSALPEWEAVREIPSFESFEKLPGYPNEDLGQTSFCNWWLDDMLDTFTSCDQEHQDIGLVKEPCQWYAQRATWAKVFLVRILQKAVRKFNKASVPGDIGIVPEQVMNIWNEKHPTNKLHELHFTSSSRLATADLEEMSEHLFDYVEHGAHCGLQIGPVKETHRVHAKVQQMKAECRPDKYPTPGHHIMEKYIRDWVRIRVIFLSPVAMATFFWYLVCKIPELRCVQAKNKLLKPPTKDMSCDIHVNVRFDVHGEEFTAEIQLVLQHFLIATDLEHKYYQFRRTTRLSEILTPVLEVLGETKASKEAQVGKTTSKRTPSKPNPSAPVDVKVAVPSGLIGTLTEAEKEKIDKRSETRKKRRSGGKSAVSAAGVTPPTGATDCVQLSDGIGMNMRQNLEEPSPTVDASTKILDKE
eukprot:gnl/MRDRNA2_/MRDRNA2_74928_c0_seq1.p1 gnl/MRDRNA2_/MRDRNA2_74928_c0~~gnl/MRDRNA2_/MRDRNA2_74928_c0_seq1.p1  ORF type:complete len:811 (-),score=110.47 gnl/MRDRNA2_/MRDRNA2_74928_c0_seq1:86-2518(-)